MKKTKINLRVFDSNNHECNEKEETIGDIEVENVAKNILSRHKKAFEELAEGSASMDNDFCSK